MYTPASAPPINPAEDNLGQLLNRHNLTAHDINHDDGDPQSKTSLVRRALNDANTRIPRRYRAAISHTPETRAWVNAVVTQAGGRVIPTVATGPSLLLLGPTGVGKTYEAYGALRDLACTGVVAKWTATSAADLYAALRPRHQVDSEAEFRKYANTPVLLVDDLGAAKASDWTEEVNYRLVNHRYEAELPTLFTSNVTPGELAAHLGDRVASRLVEMCDRVVLKGADRRRAA